MPLDSSNERVPPPVVAVDQTVPARVKERFPKIPATETAEKCPVAPPPKWNRSNVASPGMDAVMSTMRLPPSTVAPVTSTASYCVPRVAPVICMKVVLAPPSVSDPIVSRPGLLPGDSVPSTITSPPIEPLPPSVPSDPTVTSLEVSAPLTSIVPRSTAVDPTKVFTPPSSKTPGPAITSPPLPPIPAARRNDDAVSTTIEPSLAIPAPA